MIEKDCKNLVVKTEDDKSGIGNIADTSGSIRHYSCTIPEHNLGLSLECRNCPDYRSNKMIFKIESFEFRVNENMLPVGITIETIKRAAQELFDEETKNNPNISRVYELDTDPAIIGKEPKDWWILIINEE